MKTTNHIAKWIQAYFMLLFCISTVIFTACNEDKLNLDQEIYGLGGNDEQKNELDKWLYENYTQAYNIEVKYKWNSYELNTTAQLVPIMERFVKPSMDMIQRVWFEPYKQLAGDKFLRDVKPSMDMIQRVWFEPYKQLAGDKFLREMTPKKIILVGSPEYNADGSQVLGQAEGARKITLFDGNSYNPSDADWIRSIMHTIEHEFAHILHQTKMYDSSFKDISAGDYNPTGWTSETEVSALLAGFYSAYAMSGVDEDFVEVASLIMVYGKEWRDYRINLLESLTTSPPSEGETAEETAQRIALANQAQTALTRLLAKEEIVINYFKNVWNVQFYDDAMGNKGLVSLVQDAINQIVNENTPE